MITGQQLMQEFTGKDRRLHRGLIDLKNDFMKLRADSGGFDSNVEKLTMFQFRNSKVSGYERCQQAINQGLFLFPSSLNSRGELEIEMQNADGSLSTRYEKPALDELNFFVQADLAKEELVSMQKQKTASGNIKIDLTPESKSRNMHDDHADVIMMLCDYLMQLRTEEALQVEVINEDFSKIFSASPKKHAKNPFESKPRDIYHRRHSFFK